MSILGRLKEARRKARAKYKELEVTKLGNLRAGNSGIMDEHGNIAGQCHRKAHLRQLGIEIDVPTPDKLLMFDLGFANEDLVYDALVQTLGPDEVIRREEEIPIQWTTSNGTKVTGRPDMVICNYESHPDFVVPPGNIEIEGGRLSSYRPVKVLELKSVHSMWTAREVLFNRTPKMENLAQTAHYMWKLGVPGSLIYRSYSQLGQGMSGGRREDRKWMLDQFPKPGQPGSEYIEFNGKTGVPKHIKQFEIVYDLKFDSGTLCYQVEDAGPRWVSTIIKTPDIERYYEFLSTMSEKRTVGPDFLLIGADGSKGGYDHINYCDACKLVKEVKGNYDEWITLAIHSNTSEPGK